jgi:hypothetical protein
VCEHFSRPELRREIHEGLQVVAYWNSANTVIFYGKDSDTPPEPPSRSASEHHPPRASDTDELERERQCPRVVTHVELREASDHHGTSSSCQSDGADVD